MSIGTPGPDGGSVKLGSAAWLTLALLVAVYTCNYLDRYIMSLLLEPIRAEFKLTDRQLGVMASLAYGLAYAAAGIPIGMAVDRFSRRNIIAVTMALWSVCTGLCAFAGGYASLVALRASVGAAEAAASPAGMSIVADTVPPKRRAMASGILFAASPIGLFISFAGGGYVAEAYGWRAALVIAGIPGLILTGLVLWLLKEPARGRFDAVGGVKPNLKPASLAATLKFFGASPLLIMVLAAMVLLATSAASVTAWSASYLVRSHGLKLQDAGMLIAAFGGMGVILGAVGAGWLSDRLSERDRRWAFWLAAIGACAAMAAGVWMAYAQGLAAAVTAMLLYKGLAAVHLGPTFGMVLNEAPPSMRGTIIAIQYVALNLVGFGLGPVITGAISDFIGGEHSLRPALTATLALNLLAAGLLLLAGARKAPPRKPAYDPAIAKA